MIPLRVAMIIFFAASVQAQSLDVPPSAARLREMIDPACVSSGKRIGMDYQGAAERAIRREPAGLAELFCYRGDSDGEAGEVHDALLRGLLQRWGDRRFAHVLRAQKLRIRQTVIESLALSPEERSKFPLTYASAPH
jgi:hypothetical protein